MEASTSKKSLRETDECSTFAEQIEQLRSTVVYR